MAKVLLYVLANCNSAGCWLVVVVKPHCSAKTEEPQEFTKWEHKTTNPDDFVNDTTKASQESSPGGISLGLERGGLVDNRCRCLPIFFAAIFSRVSQTTEIKIMV